MLTNTELYGTNNVPPIPEEVADERIRLLDENLKRHMEVHFMSRDNNIIGAILKAKEFWRKLKDDEGI